MKNIFLSLLVCSTTAFLYASEAELAIARLNNASASATDYAWLSKNMWAVPELNKSAQRNATTTFYKLSKNSFLSGLATAGGTVAFAGLSYFFNHKEVCESRGASFEVDITLADCKESPNALVDKGAALVAAVGTTSTLYLIREGFVYRKRAQTLQVLLEKIA